MKKGTNGDIGVGESKMWHFGRDIIFEWPLMGNNNGLSFNWILFVYLMLDDNKFSHSH